MGDSAKSLIKGLFEGLFWLKESLWLYQGADRLVKAFEISLLRKTTLFSKLKSSLQIE